jgi:Aerotolerance regulator N-terminal
MAAIAAPVILHFWNDRHGKVLRIGSISLLTGASQRIAWSRRLSQWWLLLLRCLLLILLAVLLAGPYWRRTGHVKGWVLEDAGAAGAERKVVIDSLVNAGWERHILRDSLNYWNGLRVADREAPVGAPFYVVTTGLVRRFSGERPLMEREIHWDSYTPADSVRHWISAAWLSGPDSVRVLAGLSRSTGTNYSGETVAMGHQQPVAVDTSVLRVAVCTDPAFRQDGRYVVAALRALQQYTRRRIEVVETGRAPAGPFARVVFDADWNEMVWNGSLPVMMGKLLYGEDTDVAEDRRVIDPVQILPAHGRGGEPLAGGEREAGLPGASIDLAPVLWWLILLLFIIERVVSHGKRKT